MTPDQAAEIAALKMCSDEAEREVVALRAENVRLRAALKQVKSAIEEGGGGNEPDWRDTLQLRPGYEVKK